MKEVLKLGVILMVICALAGLGLAVVYAQTKPVIDQRAQEDILTAAKECIPGAAEIVQQEKDGKVFWLGKDGQKTVGAAMRILSQGFSSGTPIEMIVGVDEKGTITKVKIVSMAETPGIGSNVQKPKFLDRFKGQADPSKVDGISGATVSSRAVIGGVKNAQSFLSGIVAPKDETPIDLAKVPDGTYQGTADGLMGPITVSVTVQGGKITNVKVLSDSETPDVAGGALVDIPKAIVQNQKLDVDAVSGATFASKGIMEACKNALRAVQGK